MKSIFTFGVIFLMGLTSDAFKPAPAWSLEYDNLSEFHLQGEFLTYQSTGEYWGQIVGAGSEGRTESFYRGKLDNVLQKKIADDYRALKIEQIKNPPPKTQLPDNAPAKLLLRYAEGKSVSLLYFENQRAEMTEDTKNLIIIVQQILANVQNTKPFQTNKNIKTLSKRPR